MELCFGPLSCYRTNLAPIKPWVLEGVAKYRNSCPSSRPLLPCTNPNLPPQSRPRPSHCLHRAWSLSLHLTNVLPCDPTTSNLDSYFNIPPFSELLFLLATLRYGFFSSTLPRKPSQSRLFTVGTESVFCGGYLMKLPIEDLWKVCFSN